MHEILFILVKYIAFIDFTLREIKQCIVFFGTPGRGHTIIETGSFRRRSGGVDCHNFNVTHCVESPEVGMHVSK